MKMRISAFVFGIVLFASCKKSGSSAGDTVAAAVKVVAEVACGKEVIADKPVKAGETGIMLPVGTKLCITKDQLVVRVELPEGFAFTSKEMSAAEKTLPIYATYACYCSGSGSACQVFFADGLGFGCLQSTCSGSCTGKFTYKGYSVDRVAVTMDKEEFFQLPDVQQAAANVSPVEAYSKLSLYGVDFFVVNNEKAFLAKASCDCEGTAACKLKTVSLPLLKGEVAGKKIYYCDGGCNGCELTVN
jgi:hypothetical protein